MAPMATGSKSMTRVGLLRKPDSLMGDWIPKEEVKPVRKMTDAAGISSCQVTSISCRSPYRRVDSLTNSLCPLPAASPAEEHGPSRKRTSSNHKDGISMHGMMPVTTSDQETKLFHKKQFVRSISHDAPREQVVRGRGCPNGTKNGDQIASKGVNKCLWHDDASAADLTDVVTLLARRRPGPASALRTHIGRNGTPEPTPRPMIRCISPDFRLASATTPSSIKTTFQRQNSSTSFIEHMNTIQEPRSTLRCVSQGAARANPNILAETATAEPVRRRAAVSPNHQTNRNPILPTYVQPNEPNTPNIAPQGRKTFHHAVVHRQVPRTSPSRLVHRVPITGAPFAYDAEEPVKKTLQVGRKSAPHVSSLSPSRDTDPFRTGKRLVRRAASPMPVEQPKHLTRLRPRTGTKQTSVFSFGTPDGQVASTPTEVTTTEASSVPQRKERIIPNKHTSKSNTTAASSAQPGKPTSS